MEYVRLFLGSILFGFLFWSLHKSYWYYNNKSFIQGFIIENFENFFSLPKFSKRELGNILFIFPECHSTSKGKYWAKVHIFCWFILIFIFVFGIVNSK